MPKYKIPVVVNAVLEVEAANDSQAVDEANAMLFKSFPQAGNTFTFAEPTVKSSYEVTVTFYMDAFTHEEVEDRVWEIVRKGIGDKGAKGTGEVGFDVEAIRQGGPCRG